MGIFDGINYIIAVGVVLICLLISVFSNNTTSLSSDIIGGRTPPTQLQKDVLKKYKHLKAPKVLPTFNEFCYPRKYNIQRQQRFAGEYMKPGSKHNGLLVFHKIGAGKTCLSIKIMEKWTKRGKPLIIMPASLIPGFRAELRSCCGNDTHGHNQFITVEEQVKLKTLSPTSSEYKEIISHSNKRIDAVYQIHSYNSFSNAVASGGPKSIRAPIVVIDEVQNIDNSTGVFFKSILKWVRAHPDAPSVVMSGTPVFDQPTELHQLAELLRIIPDKNDPVEIIPETIPKLFAGKVTFYAGAPDYTFPKTYIKIKKCRMSRYQTKWYRSEVEAEMSKLGNVKIVAAPNNFYIKSRQRSNIVPPRGLTGNPGVHALTEGKIRTKLEKYSCKYAALVKKLRKNELSFVFTSFTGIGGIMTLKKILKVFGWKDFAEEGPGKKRFAIFSGEETLKEKDILRDTFNSPLNDDAGLIQIIIGSPSIKEGVSLTRVRQVHILEMYWNHSRLEQVYGRAVRYCSHKSLPKSERDVVIYLYAAIAAKTSNKSSKLRNDDPMMSIDLYMLKMADEKRDEAEPYIAALMDCAVDRLLHYN